MPLFDPATLWAYLAAATALVLIPGPGTAWIVTQTAIGGPRHGLRAALGLETATLIHALAAGLGLSALLMASALAFELLKYLGAAYLVWLGVQAWRARADATPRPAAMAAATAQLRRATPVYRRSVVVGVLNPKVAVFFLAFLPQFVDPARGAVWLQFLLLGLMLSAIGIAHSSAIALLVARLGRSWSASARAARWRRRIVGSVFIALGLRLALQQRL